MKTFVCLSLLLVSLTATALDPNSNFGEILLEGDSATLLREDYDFKNTFDPSFSDLTMDQALEGVLTRIDRYDPMKAQDWRKKIHQLWLARRELKGVVFTSTPRWPSNGRHYEGTYRVSTGQLLLSADSFYKLPGFQQAYLILQAMLVVDKLSRDKNSTARNLDRGEFDPVKSTRPYFSRMNGQGDYSSFVDFYRQQFFYPGSYPLFEAEFQKGTEIILLRSPN